MGARFYCFLGFHGQGGNHPAAKVVLVSKTKIVYPGYATPVDP